MSYFDDPAPLGSSFLPSAGFAPCVPVPAPTAAVSRQVSREWSRNDLSELFDASEELFQPISLPAPSLAVSPPRKPLPQPPAEVAEQKQQQPQQPRPDHRAAAQKFRMRYYAKLQQLAATAPRQPQPSFVSDEGGYSTEDSVTPVMSRENSNCSLSSVASCSSSSSIDLEEGSPCVSPHRRSPPIAIPARRPTVTAKAERSRQQQQQKRTERYASPSQDREDEDERDSSDDEDGSGSSPRSSLIMSRRRPLYHSGFSLAFDFSMPPPVRGQLGR